MNMTAHPLTFAEYIEAAEIRIDRHMLNTFYIGLRDNLPIYLSNELIEWCGYEGTLCAQKANLLKFIQKNNIQIIKMTNDQYEEFWNNLPREQQDYYPKVDRNHGKGKTFNILITPDNLQYILLRLPTIKGKIVAKYYINLADIIKSYWRYQAEFYKKKFEDEVRVVCELPQNILYSREQKVLELEERLQEKYRVGLVYFIHEINDMTKFKIGYTYCLSARLVELQTGNWRKLVVYKVIMAQFPQELEAHLHSYFSGKRCGGEWFDISPAEITDLEDV